MLGLRSSITHRVGSRRVGALGAALVLALLAVPGCKRKADDSAESAQADPSPGAPSGDNAQNQGDLDAPLAVVDGVTITVGEFQEQLNRQTPYVRARYTSLEKKKEFLDNLVQFEVMAKEAARRGFDKDPEVVRVMKQVMIQKLVKDEFADAFDPTKIPEDEMRAYYEEHEGDYNRPEQVRVAAVIVKERAKAKKVFEEAQGEAGKNHAKFRELVMVNSTDEETKQRGGDLGYFPRDTTEVPKPVVEAAFGLDNGGVAGPIEAGDGTFYVIKVTGKRKPLTKSFDDVKRQIQNRLYRDKRSEAQRAFVEELRAKATIEINEENLSKVEVETGREGGGFRRVRGGSALPPVRSLPR